MRLYLFTSSFPFGKGEQFLETEIEYLSEVFEKITIIPASYGGSLRQRKIPKNAIVITPILKNWKSRILNINFIPFFKSVRNRKVILKEFLQSIKRNQLRLFLSAFNIAYYTLNNGKIRHILDSTTDKDILYFYWGHGISFIIPFIKTSAKKIMRVHGGDLYEYLYNNYYPFREEQLKNLDFIVPISMDGKIFLEKKYPQYKDKIKVFKLGTRYHDYINISPKNNKRIFRIVSCSSLTPVKRVDLIVEILKTITDYPIEWIHFGDGPLKSYILNKSRKLPNNIKFILKGQVSNKEIYNFYKYNFVDLFINVSISEGIPVSIMEAISFGIPIMATNVGGVKEIVNSKIGILLERNFSISLASQYIYKLIKGEVKFDRFYIKEFWKRNFNADINYRNFAKFLVSLVK